MPIKLIACVTQYKGKLGIGNKNGLLFNLKEDLKYFQKITINESRPQKNVVLMGRKTWFSIPKEKRPLKDRLNLVLTNDKNLLQVSPYPSFFFRNRPLDKDVYFLTYAQFLDFYKRTNANVFVIGGGQIYNMFLSNRFLKPERLYITEVTDTLSPSNAPDTFLANFDASYKLLSISEKHIDPKTSVQFRFLTYITNDNTRTDEQQYLDLCKYIIDKGSDRMDRTQVGTKSSFGHQLKFDISFTVPLLTTKRVPWKHCIEELLWFLRGDTDAKLLQSKGVKIWDGNTSREFLDSHGLQHYEEGILGPGYGWQWRFFGAKYSQAFANTLDIDKEKVGGIDQIAAAIHLLKTDPYNRRIVVSAWNPNQLEEMALPPCHFAFQFYVEKRNGVNFLSCHLMQRSQDEFLGSPFNIFSYTVLTYIIALKCDMQPDKLVMSIGDAHIYKNHIDQMQEQLARTLRPLPKLILNPNIKNKDFQDISLSDFEVVGYMPHNSIKAPMAI
jgi:dihydrofolate reductase/thymidylate synthase